MKRKELDAVDPAMDEALPDMLPDEAPASQTVPQ
jgi:hypothetical protein